MNHISPAAPGIRAGGSTGFKRVSSRENGPKQGGQNPKPNSSCGVAAQFRGFATFSSKERNNLLSTPTRFSANRVRAKLEGVLKGVFMPIGVPKVAYRLPGEPTPQWIDLYNRLYRERVLFLGSDLDDELANQLVGIMIYLSSEDASKRIFIYINSPGGSTTCGFSVTDAMHHIEAHVTTLCIGIAASMASFVLAAGERGHRIALPHSRIMLHQPQGGSQGQASDVVAESSEVLKIRQRIGRIYAERTGQSLATIAKALDRDAFLSAKQAKDFGLIDQVAASASVKAS